MRSEDFCLSWRQRPAEPCSCLLSSMSWTSTWPNPFRTTSSWLLSWHFALCILMHNRHCSILVDYFYWLDHCIFFPFVFTSYPEMYWEWKYVGGSESIFDPRPSKVSHSFIQNLLDNSASFTSSKIKDLCQQWKVKGCNLKQFDGLTWLSLTPRNYNRSMPLYSKQ